MTREAPVETGKAAAAIDEIQTEKMDKLPVEAGKAVAAIDKIQTEKAPLDGEKKQFSTILAMPTELPYVIPYSRGNNIAELLGVTEEWLEEKRKLYREAAARSERISNEYLLFQEESESESDDDDEYEPQQYSEELWKSKDRSGFQFFDPDAAEDNMSISHYLAT
ncbi:unnamed protein product [Alopecurus aequalis]